MDGHLEARSVLTVRLHGEAVNLSTAANLFTNTAAASNQQCGCCEAGQSWHLYQISRFLLLQSCVSHLAFGLTSSISLATRATSLREILNSGDEKSTAAQLGRPTLGSRSSWVSYHPADAHCPVWPTEPNDICHFRESQFPGIFKLFSVINKLF